MSCVFLVLLFLTGCPLEIAENVVFVDAESSAGAGSEDGTSWDRAFDTVQEGIDAASLLDGFEVWVAQGTYGEVRSGDADGSVVMKADVAVFGGFRGNEVSIFQRDWELNETILSGDNGRGVGHAAYHVVKGADYATLDGFTITGGHAVGRDSQGQGGGMFNRGHFLLSVSNCIFTENSAEFGGGGMSNYATSPRITNCIFIGNSANSGGGIKNMYESSPKISSCSFTENCAVSGGAIENSGESAPEISYSIFTGNTASWGGGGIYNGSQTSPEIRKCDFLNNSAGEFGGGMYNVNVSSLTIKNCIFEGNEASYKGGGIYTQASSPIIQDSRFSGNLAFSGGGMQNDRSMPQVGDCIFIKNRAEHGGGMQNERSTPQVRDCIFIKNRAEQGGGMQNYSDVPPEFPTFAVISNSFFIGNLAMNVGGGMLNLSQAAPVVTNCMFIGNSAVEYGADFCTKGILSDTVFNLVYLSRTSDAAQETNSFDSSFSFIGRFV